MSQLVLDEPAPRLFECIIDRSLTKMPSYYLPSAPCVVIAGEDMLRAAGHFPGRQRPPGWVREEPGVYIKREGKQVLRVRQSGNWRSDHWAIERYDSSEEYPCEALVFPMGPGPMPIWARSYQGAMRLAEHCHPIPRPPVAGCWMPNH